jgi:deazaflavin-dependent oxidoreductase (nitroreductase family)
MIVCRNGNHAGRHRSGADAVDLPQGGTMTPRNEITDSPIGWVAKHVKRYLDSDGRDGHRFNGHDALLITTRGRKTGKLRRTALYYGRDADRYLLVASDGGSPTNPAWYLNLVEHPEIEVQVGADKFTARARTASALALRQRANKKHREAAAVGADGQDLSALRDVPGQGRPRAPRGHPRAGGRPLRSQAPPRVAGSAAPVDSGTQRTP